MRIVVVKWVDATGHSEWVDMKDALVQEICVFESVGFLLQNNKDYIQIAQSASKDTVSNTLLIPKRCVTEIK